MHQSSPYGLSIDVDVPVEQAIADARAALAREGFGIISEIDISRTLKQKLDIDFPPYVILGACNPALAHQALQSESDIGLLLPCNVVVRATEGGRSRISAMDPAAVLPLSPNEQVRKVASEVRARLERTLTDLEAHESSGTPLPRAVE